MDVIRDRTSLQQNTSPVFNDSPNVSVKFITNLILEPRFPILGGKNHMQHYLYQRLRHEF